LLAAIAASSANPVAYVAVTHPNPDKFNGASVFQQAGAKVVMSDAIAAALADVHAYKKAYFVGAKMFTDETYPPLVRPDLTFKKTLVLPLAGKAATVELTELGTAGVSGNQTVAYVPQAKALFVGDLVHHRAHAWLEGGIVKGAPTPKIKQWQSTLVRLLKYREATVSGGRGQSAPVEKAVQDQKAYLVAMDVLVAEAVRGLGPQAKAMLQGAQAAELYTAIAASAAKRFPDYALSYLVQYGVYGLAMQKAQQQ
jgi:glyoxylase-like metal-dependent hydrolase (beta-lactamase superfamily II)